VYKSHCVETVKAAVNIHTQRWGWCVRCTLVEGRRSTFQTTGRRVRRSRNRTETRCCEITCQRHRATSNEVSRLLHVSHVLNARFKKCSKTKHKPVEVHRTLSTAHWPYRKIMRHKIYAKINLS